MTTDSEGQLYVAGANSISVFSPRDNPTNPVALSVITLPSRQSPIDVAVDKSGNIYVACVLAGTTTPTGSIFVFSSGSSGTATPVQTITSEALFSGLAVDAAGNIFAVENTATMNAPGVANGEELVEFAAGANGAAIPIKTISGSATGMTFGGEVKLDSVGNIYLVNITITGISLSPAVSASILCFGPAAAGNESPASTITSTAWTIPGYQLALK
jgi:hypothetical protein